MSCPVSLFVQNAVFSSPQFSYLTTDVLLFTCNNLITTVLFDDIGDDLLDLTYSCLLLREHRWPLEDDCT